MKIKYKKINKRIKIIKIYKSIYFNKYLIFNNKWVE